MRRNRNNYKKKKEADNTYNLGYLSKPQAPTWTDTDGTEGKLLLTPINMNCTSKNSKLVVDSARILQGWVICIELIRSYLKL